MPWLVTTGPALLYAGAFGLGFVILALSLGRRISIWLGARNGASTSEQAVLWFVGGASALQLVAFVLGAAGVLSVANVRLATLVVAVALAYDAWAVLRLIPRISGVSRPTGWRLWWLLTLLPGLALALASALTPTVDPDGMGYHLTVPKRWLVMGSIGYLPTYAYSNTPMGVEMLFTLGLAWAGDTAAKLIHFLMGLGAALSAYLLGKRLTSGALSELAVTILLFGPFGLSTLMGWAYVEASAACALVASALAWMVWFESRQASYLRCAGLLAGMGASFKLTAALVPVALSALTLVILLREDREQRRSWAGSAKLLSMLVAFVALPVLPWLARSAIMTGNPFFPMFAQIIPSRDFTALQSKQFDEYNRYMAWGVGSGKDWSLGLRKQMLAGAALALALPGAFLAWRQRTFLSRTVAWVVLVSILVQLSAAGLYKRYWMPLLAVAALPMLLLGERWLRERWAEKAVVVASAALSLFAAKQILASVGGDLAGLLKTPLGIERQRAFLERQLTMLPIYDSINREAPPSAGVMLAANCSGFHIDRSTYCADLVQSALRVSSWDEFKSDLLRLGISYVIAPLDWQFQAPDLSVARRIEVGNTSYLIRDQEHVMVHRLLRENSRMVRSAADQGLFAIDLGSLK